MTLAEFAGPAIVWIAILIGFGATILVLRNARSMKGGVFEKVLNLFGLGMLLVLVGLFIVAVPRWSDSIYSGIARDVLFALGYLSMAYGAKRLLDTRKM